MKTLKVTNRFDWLNKKPKAPSGTFCYFNGGEIRDAAPNAANMYFVDVVVRASDKGDWTFEKVSGHHSQVLSDEKWIAERLQYSLVLLKDWIEVDPLKRSGVPVLRGTRFTVSQMLAELADGRSSVELAEDFDLDIVVIQNVLHGFSIYLDRPASR
jgi:uncharacterized protein (DUF433 family)